MAAPRPLDKELLKPVLVGRLASEIGSVLGATGIVPLLEGVAPHDYDKLKEHVAKTIVAPRLGWLEAHMVRLPAFSQAAKQIGATDDDAKKSLAIASALVDFSVMTVASTVGQGVVQGVANHISGLPLLHPEGVTGFRRFIHHAGNLAKPILFERVTNLALISALQLGVPKQTEKATEHTADLLHKTIGLPPSTTTYLLQWKLPELVGATAGALMLTRSYQNAGGLAPAAR